MLFVAVFIVCIPFCFLSVLRTRYRLVEVFTNSPGFFVLSTRQGGELVRQLNHTRSYDDDEDCITTCW